MRWLLLLAVAAVLAVTLSEGLRERVLEALFGAEEEFVYEPSAAAEAERSGASDDQS